MLRSRTHSPIRKSPGYCCRTARRAATKSELCLNAAHLSDTAKLQRHRGCTKGGCGCTVNKTACSTTCPIVCDEWVSSRKYALRSGESAGTQSLLLNISSNTHVLSCRTPCRCSFQNRLCAQLATCTGLTQCQMLMTSHYTVMSSAPAFALGNLTNALHPCKTRSCNATLRLRPFVQTEAELVVELKRRGISIEWR